MWPTDTYSVFLLLDPFERVWRELCSRMPIWPAERRLFWGADGYYSPEVDSMVVALRFRGDVAKGLGPRGIEAMLPKIPVPRLALDELSVEDHQTLFRNLAAFPVFEKQRPVATPEHCLVERVVRALLCQAAERDLAITEADEERERRKRAAGARPAFPRKADLNPIAVGSMRPSDLVLEPSQVIDVPLPVNRRRGPAAAKLEFTEARSCRRPSSHSD